jgi:hypothetical protein
MGNLGHGHVASCKLREIWFFEKIEKIQNLPPPLSQVILPIWQRRESSATAVMAAMGVSDSKRNAARFSHCHEAISNSWTGNPPSIFQMNHGKFCWFGMEELWIFCQIGIGLAVSSMVIVAGSICWLLSFSECLCGKCKGEGIRTPLGHSAQASKAPLEIWNYEVIYGNL